MSSANSKTIATPDLGGATDVTVIEILVKPGDKVTVDMPIVTLESDKATLEVPATEAGIVKEVKVKIGEKISSGSPLITLEAGGAKDKASKTDTEKKPKPEKVTKSAPVQEVKVEEVEEVAEPVQQTDEDEAEDAEVEVLTGTIQSSSDIHAGPGVRRLARELGVDLGLIPGSGPKQRILKEDLQTFVKTRLSQLQPSGAGLPLAPLPTIDFSQFGPTALQPLSRIKKIAGKNLQRNWMMIPHVTQFGEADITALEEFRQELKPDFDKQNIKLTPLVFIMKAVVAALKAFPHFNATLDPAGENLIMKGYFNIGVAVDTPDGLVVPVIRDVDKKGLTTLAQELATVSEKARKKQLLPADMQGGCFSISSLGGIGGTAFTPIINYPEVAILGVSKSTYRPVYEDGKFIPRLMLPLSLSYDHRVIDGADGARFIVHLSKVLSDIRNLLL